MRLCKSTILVSVSLLLVQCVNEELVQPGSIADATIVFPPVTKKTLLSEEWTYNFSFYSGELTLNVNGAFTFHEQGCLGHGFTKGTWSNSGNDLVVNSYIQYKEFSKPFSDSENLYFSNVRYRFEHNSLVKLDSNGNKTSSIYQKKATSTGAGLLKAPMAQIKIF